MKVATWNLWWRFGDNWRDRERGIVETLRRVDADVVGLQEVWGTAETNQAAVLAEQLGMHHAFVEGGLPPVPNPVENDDQTGVTMGVGLLSRWPLRSVSAHRLPSEGRDLKALLASIDHPDGPLRVAVSGTSWEPERLDELSEQLKQLACLVADPVIDGPMPALLIGDFNAPPNFAGMREVTSRLVDTWAAVHRADEDGRTLSETNRFAPREAELQFNERIDYVFARPGTKDKRLVVRDAAVIRDEIDGMPPSDHYLVVADLEQE